MTATEDLFAGLTPNPSHLDRLRGRLADAATGADLVDVAWREVDSPFGPLLVAATTRGVVKVAFQREDHDAVLSDLASRVGPRVLRAPSQLDDLARQLEEYFGGQRHVVDVPLDLRLASGFRREVVEALPTIAYGDTASYGELARTVGHPRAARAVGTACARNPLPLVLPCHRVVRSDGSPGQYGGGPEAKRWLLAHEAGR